MLFRLALGALIFSCAVSGVGIIFRSIFDGGRILFRNVEIGGVASVFPGIGIMAITSAAAT